MKKIFNNEFFWLLLIVCLAALLRFYKISLWQHLTYDQARDYLVLKKMIVNHKFTLVGPSVSIAPGVFLPPFYYYSLIPLFWLFKMTPLGPDIYTALFSVFSVVVFYFLAKDFIKLKIALFTSLLFACNPYLIHFSRHAWNPNTVIFYILFFALSFERYFFQKKRNYLLLASFSLAWAIGLHLTAVVFLPFLFYLYFREIKSNRPKSLSFLSGLLFLLIFLPLVIFDFRHNYPILKACSAFVGTQKSTGLFNIRFKEIFIDLFKMPVVLLSGLFQKQNLTVRPSDISSFGNVGFFLAGTLFEKIKFILTSFFWVFSFFGLLRNFKSEKARLIIYFFVFSLLVRLFFPPNSFYFYYYIVGFPFVYLGLAYFLETTFVRLKILRTIFLVIAVLIMLFSLLPQGIYAEAKNQNFFLPVCKIINQDFPYGKRVVIAGNVADKSRWEKNGMEYRYFLESKYGLSLLGDTNSDYTNADVLYFIDETGRLTDPLKFRGMEMEAFHPKKIEKVWVTETGHKIYKLIK